MSNEEAKTKLGELYEEMMAVRAAMLDLQKSIEPEPIQDYELQTQEGSRHVSSYFGSHDTLFLIHNMGSHCVYCTVWADGFNGIIDHLQDRAGFVLTSPETPAKQQAFAASRGWKFPIASVADSSLPLDLGYYHESGEALPGVSVLKKLANGSIGRVADTPFGPGDPYCALFNLFDLMPDGDSDWQPKFAY
ncbi:MAG: DUF899 domain-containing protein [Gammaproteobacteria bacterium]|nr:DUF899 domain-containing protein [Gammaproteobacteria bacterium]